MEWKGAPGVCAFSFPVFDRMKELEAVVRRKKIEGVQRYIVAPDLEMQMIACRYSSAAHQSDNLALSHKVALFNEICGKMRIAGDEVVAVFDIDCIAETGKID